MKRISNRPTLRVVSEISVTPLLILVLLVLLVFLMAVPVLKRKPQAAAQVKPPTEAVLAVAHDQTITFEGAPVAQAALLDTLKKRVAAEPKTGVIVKMDRRLPVQNLLEVMAVLKAAGVSLTAVASTADSKP